MVFLTSLAGRAFDLDVDVAHLASTTLGVALMGIDFGLFAMAVGARTGNKGEALGIASGGGAPPTSSARWRPSSSGSSRPATLSLFYWAVGDGQLDEGLSLASLAVLLGVSLVLVVVTLRLFDRHDLT